MDSIYEWMKNLSFFAVLGTAVLQIIPDQGFRKYVRFFTGLLMVSMLILPVLKIAGKEDFFADVYKSRDYQEQIEDAEKKRQNLLEQIQVLKQNDSENKTDIKSQESDTGTVKRIEVEQIEIGKDREQALGE